MKMSQTLEFIINQLFYKISNGQERKKECKSEVQKFNNLEDKKIFFGKTKSIFDIKIKNSEHKL